MSLRRALERHSLTPRQRALTHRLAALLLDYPDPRLLADLPTLREAAAVLPDPPRTDLLHVVDYLATTPPNRLAEHYVDTFDLRRRCTLHVTYSAHGDTRERGTALLAFGSAYRRAGFTTADGELPDHLCVVLEFAATVDAHAGARLLHRYRAGLELLRLALRDAGSPYLGAVAAVDATLPPPTGRLTDRVTRLAAEGPPDEQVGLAPFPPPQTGRVPS